MQQPNVLPFFQTEMRSFWSIISRFSLIFVNQDRQVDRARLAIFYFSIIRPLFVSLLGQALAVLKGLRKHIPRQCKRCPDLLLAERSFPFATTGDIL